MASTPPIISILQASAYSSPPYENNRKQQANQNGQVDPKDRDPRKMNQHVTISFNDVIGEPDPGTQSFGPIWYTSHQVFLVTKLWCYRILSVVFAIPLAVLWAILFAFLSFFQIWCCTPCLRSCRIQCRCIREMLDLIAHTFLSPLVDALGRFFSNMRLTYTQRGGDIHSGHERDEEYDDDHGH